MSTKKIKLGVDARLLSRPLTGIGRYTLEMCHALSKLDGLSLYLYSPAPIFKQYLPRLEGAVIQTKNFDSGMLRQIWGESYLPWWIKQDEIDVFWGPAHRLPRCLSDRLARVVTIHDLVWKLAGETMRPISRFMEKYQMPSAIRNADVVVADSKATADAVNTEFCVEPGKLSVIPLGVSLMDNSLSFDSLAQYAVSCPYFLFVGTLEPRKNLMALLTAYSQLDDITKNSTSLVIAGGEGWGDINLKHIIQELHLTRHVCLLGYVNEATLSTLYKNACFLAMPSLYEGFGLPIIEAMSHGIPVLTANNSSMPEVAGDAGFLVDAQDIEAIGKGLKELILNHDLRGRLAKKAKANASKFDWNDSATKLVATFEQAMLSRLQPQ